jgi:hypothetical protein
MPTITINVRDKNNKYVSMVKNHLNAGAEPTHEL